MGSFNVDHCYEDVDLTIEWSGDDDGINMGKVMSAELNVGSEFFKLPVDNPVIELIIREYEEDMLRDAEYIFDQVKPGLFRSSNGYGEM